MNDQRDKDPEKITEEDEALWQHVTKSVDPLKDRNVEESTEPQKTARNKTVSKDVHKDKKQKSEPQKDKARPGKPEVPQPLDKNVDIRTAEKLRRGQMPIEAILDLHGMNRRDAQDKFEAFVLAAWAKQKRCLLVITGKGRAGHDDETRLRLTPGVLRSSLPEWLEAKDLADKVLMTSPAKPQHGGDGAFYILLRRKR